MQGRAWPPAVHPGAEMSPRALLSGDTQPRGPRRVLGGGQTLVCLTVAGDWEQKVQAKEKEQEPRERGEMWAEARAGSLFQEVLKGLDLCLPPQSPVAYAPTPQIQYTRAHTGICAETHVRAYWLARHNPKHM